MFAENLKAARKKAGMTQAELGYRMAVSGAMIAQYENGLRRPKIETIQRFADVIPCDIRDLMTTMDGDMRNVSFTVPGKPTGKARPRVVTVNGHARAYTPKETAEYEGNIRLEYRAQCGNAYFKRGVPLMVQIVVYMPIPKSASQKQREKMLRGALQPVKKPDWDNIGKIICDALNGVAWHDDAKIVLATVSKRYGLDEGVQVCVSEVRHEEAMDACND